MPVQFTSNVHIPAFPEITIDMPVEQPVPVKPPSKRGFGEIDLDQHQKDQQDFHTRVKRVAFASIALAVLGFICIGLGIALGGAATIATGGLAGILFTGALIPIILMALEKRIQLPPTNFMGLNAEDHGFIPLDTMSDNHSVIVTEHGKESMDWRLELIKNAKQSIEISGSFCGGKVYRESLEAIRDNMRDNPVLKAHILACKDLLYYEDIDLMEKIATEFPERFKYLISDRRFEFYPGFHSTEFHAKMEIIDGKFLLTGGSNFTDSWNCKADGTEPSQRRITRPIDLFDVEFWRDWDVVIRGDLAETMRLEFFKLLALQSYKEGRDLELVNHYFPLDPKGEIADCQAFETSPKKIDKVALKGIVGSPRGGYNGINEEYLRLIEECQPWHEIEIGNLRFTPSQIILDAFKRAVESGVSLDVITNEPHWTAPMSHLFVHANRLHYHPLMKAAKNNNVKFHSYNVRHAMYHTKAAVFNSQWALVGSNNFGPKSDFSDEEFLISICDQRVAAAFQRNLAVERNLSLPISAEDALRWQGCAGIPGRFQHYLTSRFGG